MSDTQNLNYGYSFVNSTPSISDLRLVRPDFNGQVYIVTGNQSSGDGDGAMYVWSDTSSLTDDGVDVIASQYSGSLGRWLIIDNAANLDSFKLSLASSTGASLIGYNGTTVSGQLDSINSQFTNLPSKSVTDYGVVDDPNGTNISANMTAYLNAFKETAGKYRLYHPSDITVVMTGFSTGALSNIYWQFDGTWKLADNTNESILDISGWDTFVIEGIGTFDGNKSAQSGGYPKVLGGIISNVSGTQDSTTATNSVGATITIPPMPVASSVPSNVSNGRITGITITNVFNWPLNLAYINNVIVDNITMHDSNGSPQFFESATNCWIINSTIYNIDDGGFVFYRGNSYCGAYGNMVHDCNDGIGVYAEYDMLPINKFITIQQNIVYNNKDSGIGITTGLTPPALNQQRIIVSNNLCYNNNTSGRDGGGSIGIIGSQGVIIKDNIIFGDGNTNTGTNPSYGIFVDAQSAFIEIEGNQIADIGSSTGKGYAIWLAGPNNCTVKNNTAYNTQGSNGVTNALIAGQFGAGCYMNDNNPLGLLASAWDQVEKPSDLLYSQRRGNDNVYAISNGLAVESGDLVVDTGLFATSTYYGATAQGTTQDTAQEFEQQVIVVTTASGANAGIKLPSTLFGTQFTIYNRSGQNILIYPPSNGQIEGLAVNAGVQLNNTFSATIVGIASSTQTGGIWFGSNAPTIGNYTWNS